MPKLTTVGGLKKAAIALCIVMVLLVVLDRPPMERTAVTISSAGF
jgi:hypothetical protein